MNKKNYIEQQLKNYNSQVVKPALKNYAQKTTLNDIWKAQGELGAKNLLVYPYLASTTTINGVTFTDNGNGSITVNGTATAATYYNIQTIDFGDIPMKSYNATSKNSLYALTDGFDGHSANFYVGYDGGNRKTFIAVANGTTVDNVTAYPMIRLASDTDDTWQPYVPTNKELNDVTKDIYKTQSILGAKNLLKYPYPRPSGGYSGVIFTAQSDGSFLVNGTAVTYSHFNPYTLTTSESAWKYFNLRSGKYIMSLDVDNIEKITNGYVAFLIRFNDKRVSPNVVTDYILQSNGVAKSRTFEITQEMLDALNSEDVILEIRIFTSSNSTVDNVTVYPMIRLASDTDDTWTPYAKSNKQLTDDVTEITESVNTLTTQAQSLEQANNELSTSITPILENITIKQGIYDVNVIVPEECTPNARPKNSTGSSSYDDKETMNGILTTNIIPFSDGVTKYKSNLRSAPSYSRLYRYDSNKIFRGTIGTGYLDDDGYFVFDVTGYTNGYYGVAIICNNVNPNTLRVAPYDEFYHQISTVEIPNLVLSDETKESIADGADDNIDANEIKIENKHILFDINHLTNLASNRYIENGIYTFIAPRSGNNWAHFDITASDLEKYDGKCTVFINVTSISGEFRIYRTFTKNDGTTDYSVNKKITKAGLYEYSIDTNNMAVYEDYNDGKIQIIVANDSNSSDQTSYQIQIDRYDAIVGDSKFGNNVDNVEKALLKINAEANNALSVAINNSRFISPNGTAYVPSVNNNGELTFIPLLPTDILYIGNSLLLGFGTHGMASTSVNDDYYAKINAHLAEKTGATISAQKLSGVDIENSTTTSTAEKWITNSLAPKLSNSLQFVLVQIGDNINNTEKIEFFRNHFSGLLQYIRENTPNARVACISTWYSNNVNDAIIQSACIEKGCTFIDISDISAKTENHSYIGATYYDSNGDEQTISLSGVASHPSDAGFTAIANRVIEMMF